MAESFRWFPDQTAFRQSLSEGKCICWKCIKDRGEQTTIMILCPMCRNKRCPKASNHSLACSGSNEPGQKGSVYE